MRLDQLLPLLALFAGLTFNIDRAFGGDDESSAAMPASNQTTRLKTKSLNLYVKQHEVIDLPLYIEIASSQSNVCTFEPKKPFLSNAIDIAVSSNKRTNKSAELLERLRSVEDQTTETLIAFSQYVFVKSNRTSVSIFGNNKAGQFALLTRYEIFQQIPETHFPFSFNRQVLIPTQKGLLRCHDTGYQLVSWPNPQLSPRVGTTAPIQISPTTFLIIHSDKLDTYSYQGGFLSFLGRITFDQINYRYRDSTVITWLKCQTQGQRVYCLDKESGLFSFNALAMPDLVSYQRIVFKKGCENFYINQLTKTIQMLCIANEEAFLYTQTPNSTKTQPLPYYIHRMIEIPQEEQIAAYVRKSMITLKHFKYPNQSANILINEPIIDIDFVDEVLPESEFEKEDYDEKAKKGLASDERQITVEEEVIEEREQYQVFAYILFKDRISRRKLAYLRPRISCSSQSPTTSSFQIKMYSELNELEILPIRLSVSEVAVAAPPNKHLFVLVLTLAIVGLVIFLCIIHYYERVQRKVADIYLRLNEKTKAEKKRLDAYQI